MKHKPVLEPEADRFVGGEPWFQRFEKKHTDIWRALKPLTFIALALKPSTSIKSVKRERQRRQLIGEKQREEKQEIAGKKEKDLGEGERERWGVDLSHKLHLTFDHCLHDNELYIHIYMYTVYIQYIFYIEGLEFYISLCMTTGPL